MAHAGEDGDGAGAGVGERGARVGGGWERSKAEGAGARREAGGSAPPGRVRRRRAQGPARRSALGPARAQHHQLGYIT